MYCYLFLFFDALLDRFGHLGNGHQGTRDLIQYLVVVFLFRQRLGEKRYDTLWRNCCAGFLAGRVTGYLVMFTRRAAPMSARWATAFSFFSFGYEFTHANR
jgi:hypothetical protein